MINTWSTNRLFSSALGFRDSEKEPGGDYSVCVPLGTILRDASPHPSDVRTEGAPRSGSV